MVLRGVFGIIVRPLVLQDGYIDGQVQHVDQGTSQKHNPRGTTATGSKGGDLCSVFLGCTLSLDPERCHARPWGRPETFNYFFHLSLSYPFLSPFLFPRRWKKGGEGERGVR